MLSDLEINTVLLYKPSVVETSTSTVKYKSFAKESFLSLGLEEVGRKMSGEVI
jgi:hypothetical protein